MAKKKNASSLSKDELSANYNRFKKYGNKQYTGMKVGGSHKWYYDKGEWHETKITPDLWAISYSVTKRRAGKAPKGAGVPKGTGYHWFIIAHQNVNKLNLDDYSTSMNGLKFKLAHKRAGKEKWNASSTAQRKNTILFLKGIIRQLSVKPIAIEFEYEEKMFTGEVIPILESCQEGKCYQFEVSINNENIGIIRWLKSGWKMHSVDDSRLVRMIGKEIDKYYALTSAVPKAKSKRIRNG
jgi:hypothetical protein